MSVAETTKVIYESDYRVKMEAENMGKFIAIEPDSRRNFVGDTFIEVSVAAKTELPDKMSFAIKVGGFTPARKSNRANLIRASHCHPLFVRFLGLFVINGTLANRPLPVHCILGKFCRALHSSPNLRE